MKVDFKKIDIKKIKFFLYENNINLKTSWRPISFVCLNLISAFIILYILFNPIVSFLSERSERISDKAAILTRYDAVVAQENQVNQYSQKVAESNALGELFIGPSEGTVNANLQARLKALSDQNAVVVRSIQMLPKKSSANTTLIGGRIDVSGSYSSILTFIQSLELEPPILLIANATLRKQATPWQITSDSQQTIDAQIDVYAGALIGAR